MGADTAVASIQVDFELFDRALEESRELDEAAQTGVVVYLPDGDIHVCKGHVCPHVIQNDDKLFVCSMSNIVVGAPATREDLSTGRIEGSANPDDLCGTLIGGFAQKRDFVALNDQAACLANTSEAKQEEIEFIRPHEKKRRGRPAIKRGARCVDAPTDSLLTRTVRRRLRAPDLNVKIESPCTSATASVCSDDECAENVASENIATNADTRAAFAALVAETHTIINKLVNFERKAETASSLATKQKTVPRGDPRLLNPAILFKLGVEKYGRECLATGTVPSINVIHNLELVAQSIAATERKKNETVGCIQGQGSGTAQSALLLRVRVRELVSILCAKLWQASSASPYMRTERRSSDSFKPFVSGALYALKRGVQLSDGTPVLPASPELAASLPALRATAARSSAKALHASSHRGLCTLHRSIASLSPEQQRRVFAESANTCSQLVRVLKERRFDIT